MVLCTAVVASLQAANRPYWFIREYLKCNVGAVLPRTLGSWSALFLIKSRSQCAKDLEFKKGTMNDIVKTVELKAMVRALLRVCVTGTPNIGGMATNLGKDGNLSLKIARSKWAVIYGPDDSGTTWQKCRPIF